MQVPFFRGTGEMAGHNVDDNEPAHSVQMLSWTIGQDRFMQFCETLRQVAWIFDAKCSRLLFVNSAFERIWGVPAQRLLVEPDCWLECLHPEDRDRVSQAYAHHFREDSRFEEEYRIVSSDGTIRWILDRGFPLIVPGDDMRCYAGIAEDVTDRHSADERLGKAWDEMERRVRERTEELRLANVKLREEIEERREVENDLIEKGREFLGVFRTLPDLYFRLKRDGTIVSHVGEKPSDLYVQPTEFLGKRMQDMLPPDVGRLFLDAFARVAQSDDPVTLEYTLQVPSGQQWFEAHMVAHGDDEYIVIARNITARKHAEEERARLDQQLEYTQRLESLGLLAGGIAHDFNNLLMAILGNSELILVQLSQGSPLADLVRQIRQAGLRCADLCKQLQAYAGSTERHVTVFSLSQLVAEMKELLSISVPKYVTLEYALKTKVRPVHGDPGQLRQVILNLVTNAAESMKHTGGRVRISTRIVEADRKFLSTTLLGQNLPAGTYTCLEVRDEGCGMDAETAAKVFDPFFTTKAMGATGRGLGLAVVLGIVRAHQGTILVKSRPNKGTRMQILLPCTDQPEQPLQPSEESADTWTSSGTILVVDDEAFGRKVSEKILEHHGFSVLAASGGEEAIGLFREQHHRIDVVLLDYQMPGMHGVAVAHDLRLIQPDVRIVLTSGCSDRELRRLAVEAGAVGAIAKPYRAEGLLRAVCEAIPESRGPVGDASP